MNEFVNDAPSGGIEPGRSFKKHREFLYNLSDKVKVFLIPLLTEFHSPVHLRKDCIMTFHQIFGLISQFSNFYGPLRSPVLYKLP